MTKTHYIHGCDKGKNSNFYGMGVGRVTSDLSQVDCKSCANIIKKHNLKPRDLFPEKPTFDVVATGCWRNAPNEEAQCHLSFKCPVCGKINLHGGYFNKIGAADGERGAHCGCWKKGYFIREVTAAT